MVRAINRSNFEIVQITEDMVLLKDVGPWDKFCTITNNAENVVEEVAPILNNRKLKYYDSEGTLTELYVESGKFAGFGPGV